jgi:hypothetical protein
MQIREREEEEESRRIQELQEKEAAEEEAAKNGKNSDNDNDKSNSNEDVDVRSSSYRLVKVDFKVVWFINKLGPILFFMKLTYLLDIKRTRRLI